MSITLYLPLKSFNNLVCVGGLDAASPVDFEIAVVVVFACASIVVSVVIDFPLLQTSMVFALHEWLIVVKNLEGELSHCLSTLVALSKIVGMTHELLVLSIHKQVSDRSLSVVAVEML